MRDGFTQQWNDALTTLDSGATPSGDAFAETGDVLLLNYPEELHPLERTNLLPPHAFLGSAVRTEPVDAEVEAWLARGDRPIVYVSLGSFLSVRGDVLAAIAEALLAHSALAVSHGGNNSVTEALTASVPLLLLPLSTDQFAGAAALEDARLGEALDPNSASPTEIRDAAQRLLALPEPARRRLDALGASLVASPGAHRARAALLAHEF